MSDSEQTKKKVTFGMSSEQDYYELSENQNNPPRTRRPSTGPTGCSEFFHQCDPRKDPAEFLNTLALGLLLCGLILVTVAFMIPRDYKFNPNLPAAEMEAIELRYALLGKRLDICIAAGTVLVALGALIIGGIFMAMLVRGDFLQCFENNMDDDVDGGSYGDDGRRLYKDQTCQKDYGTDQRDSGASTSTQTETGLMGR